MNHNKSDSTTTEDIKSKQDKETLAWAENFKGIFKVFFGIFIFALFIEIISKVYQFFSSNGLYLVGGSLLTLNWIWEKIWIIAVILGGFWVFQKIIKGIVYEVLREEGLLKAHIFVDEEDEEDVDKL